MGVQAVIGEQFTFQVLFVDASNTPIAVTSPAISVFRYDQSGVKQYLANAVAMSAGTPAEVGRYTYRLVIPTSITDGTAIYGEMSGIDPGTSDVLLHEQEVTAVSPNRALGVNSGLTPHFVKP